MHSHVFFSFILLVHPAIETKTHTKNFTHLTILARHERVSQSPMASVVVSLLHPGETSNAFYPGKAYTSLLNTAQVRASTCLDSTDTIGVQDGFEPGIIAIKRYVEHLGLSQIIIISFSKQKHVRLRLQTQSESGNRSHEQDLIRYFRSCTPPRIRSR